MARWFRRLSFALLGLYAVATWRGWEVGAATKGFVPPKEPQQRAARGRGSGSTFIFWGGGK